MRFPKYIILAVLNEILLSGIFPFLGFLMLIMMVGVIFTEPDLSVDADADTNADADAELRGC